MKLTHYHEVIANIPSEVKEKVKKNLDIFDMEHKIKEIYKEFCKETKRSGGVLVGSSLGEWHFYLASKLI